MKTIILISIILLALSLPASAQNIVSIGNFTVDGNVEIRIPIYLNDSTNVAGAQIRLDFDPAVVRAYSDPNLDQGTFIPILAYSPDNSNNASGWITITVAKSGIGGLNGNQVIGYVRLKAVGDPGSSSPLDLSIIALTNDAGDDVLPVGVTNGTFDITGSTLKYIVISPSPTTTLTVGGNQLFIALAQDQDRNPLAGIKIFWTISNSSVGNVDSTNSMTTVTGGATTTFTAFVAGITMVNATNGSVKGTARVTVNNVPAFLNSIEVSPPSKTLLVGDNFTFTASPKDQNGAAFTATVAWSSSNLTVGTVDASGKFIAKNPGTAMVNATNGSVTGTAIVTSFLPKNGDINGNGQITLVDAIYLAKHVGGFSGYEVMYADGDINANGQVTLVDAIYLAKHVGGFIGYEKIY